MKNLYRIQAMDSGKMSELFYKFKNLDCFDCPIDAEGFCRFPDESCRLSIQRWLESEFLDTFLK